MKSIVDSIYRAAVDPDHWPQLLSDLVDYCDAEAGYIYVPHIEGVFDDDRPPIVSHNFNMQEHWNLYERYRLEDRVSVHLLHQASKDFTRVVTLVASNPPPEIIESDYYQVYLRTMNCGDLMVLVLGQPRPVIGVPVVGLSVPWGTVLSPAQIDRFEELAPHLQRVGHLIFDVMGNRIVDPVLRGAIDYTPVPTMLLHQNQTVVHANKLAQAFVAGDRGLALENNRVKLQSAAEQRKFTQLLQQTLGGKVPTGGEMQIADPSGRPNTLLVLPLGTDNPFRESSGPVGSVLYIIESSNIDFGGAGIDRLKSIYQLTTAEAQVGVALIEGKSAEDIARSRVRSMATVRSQIRMVLSKTGFATIRELQSLNQLLRMPKS